jgi:peptide deformylase
MTIKTIIRMGHPTLKRLADPIAQEEFNSPELINLISDLYDTMKVEDGIGIAAPQINVSKQVALIEIPPETEHEPTSLITIINPTITILDQSLQGYWEGCLSVAGLRGFVERPRKIQVDYFSETGASQSIIAEGFLATVFQHELDHLFGKIYIERMTDLTKLAFNEEFKEFIKPT